MERVTDFYSIKNRNKRNSFRRGTPDAIRDAPVRSPHKADNKKQTPQSNTVDCGAVFLARLMRFERTTHSVGGYCSIQLSYRRKYKGLT